MKTSDKTSQVFRFDTVFKHYWLLRSGRLCFVAEVGVLGTNLRQSAGKWVSSDNLDKSRTANCKYSAETHNIHTVSVDRL